MAVVLARVDNRLVHGQILEAWVPRLKADTIVVIDRDLVADALRKSLLQGLSHAGLEVRLMDPEQAAFFVAGEGEQRRVILIFSDIRRAVEALEAGVCFDRLNLGNIHPEPGSRAVTRSVNLTADDARALAGLRSRGVCVEARAVPSDRSPDLNAFTLGARP